MLTKKQIDAMSRAQVWQHINQNQLGIKKHMDTVSARKALVDYYKPVTSSRRYRAKSKSVAQPVQMELIHQDIINSVITDTPDTPVTPLLEIVVPVSIAKVSKKSKSASKISISAQSLQDLISVAKIAKTSKVLLQQKDGEITSTAVGVGITANNQVSILDGSKSWDAVVDGTLSSYVKKLKSGDFVSINGDDGTLKVESFWGSLELDTDNTDFPEALEFGSKVTNSFTCGTEALLKAVKTIAPCRSSVLESLSSILVKIDATVVTLAATDGSRLAVAKVDLLYDRTPPAPFVLNIPAQLVYGLLTLNMDSVGGSKVTIHATNSHIKVTFSNSKMCLICTKTLQEFANINSVIDQVGNAHSNVVKFDSGLVRNRLQLLAPITTLSTGSTVTLTLDRSGHAHIVAADVSHIADTGFDYSGVPIDRKFEFDYGFFIQGLDTGSDNESIELSCPDNVPFVKMSTQNFDYYLASVG